MAHHHSENIFGFTPSIPAAVVFIVAFFILTVIHVWLVVKKNVKYFSVFCIGGGFEVIGYIVRIISRNDPGNVGPYAAQVLFILLPPCFFAASIYMTLGRLIRYLNLVEISPIKLSIMTPVFVFGDVLSLLLQGAGGGIQGANSNNVHGQQVGSFVIIGGLVVQLIFFGAFFTTCIIVHKRINGRSNLRIERDLLNRFFWTIYIACILIFIRAIYRIIEFAQGFQGFLQVHEVFMYIFDAVLMFFVMLVFIVYHPGNVMVGDNGKEQEKSIEMDQNVLRDDSDGSERALNEGPFEEEVVVGSKV